MTFKLCDCCKSEPFSKNCSGGDMEGGAPEVVARNDPLICPLCNDYYLEPCILSCYHTFCARCLRGREQDRRLTCPFCRQNTLLKDGSMLPPPDTLMRQLIEVVNSENPPCSNCDKRDRQNMYYCNTCGQALCSHCRDNTHRAKMFAQHDIVHISKCTKEPKRCPNHGEPYITFSPLQNAMLCVNCFSDSSIEIRTQCLDIETAHAQAAKRLERGQNSIMDLQTSVRDGIIALKGLMDELRRNSDTEKHTINTFCQGMQEAMSKTHAAMIMEVQRQFESKDRLYRSQLLVLGTVMPVLQLHLVLCTTFTSAANKYQFLELCPQFIERLTAVGKLSQPVRSLQSSAIKTNYRSEFAQCLEPWIGQTAVNQHLAEIAAASCMYDTAPPPTKKQQNVMKTKVLEAESSFSSHCRSFESQIRELNQQFNMVKERVNELHKDINALRKAQAPPLAARYEMLTKDCVILDQSLERQQQELDRMSTVFDASWEEQLWRLRVEQEVFSCQRADLMTLRNELKHLSGVAAQLEPYIRALASQQQGSCGMQQQQQQQQQQSQNVGVDQSVTDQQAQQIQNLLMEHFGIMKQTEASLGKIPRSRSRVLGQLLEKVRPNIPDRERSKSASQPDKPLATPQKPKKAFTTQQLNNMERLETHLKEKIHDIICRRQSQSAAMQQQQKSMSMQLSKSDTETDRKEENTGTAKRIMYKKIGKSCDKINQSCPNKLDSTHQNVKAMVHHHSNSTESRSTPGSPKCSSKTKPKVPLKQKKPKVYPYSDGEDNVFYSLHDSADSLSTSSRRSSFEGPDKTLVVVINRRNNSKNMSLAQKQRSWETFPPKRRHHVCHKLSAPSPMPLRKTDSFEGHEEAVKTIVKAVQENRRKPKGGN